MAVLFAVQTVILAAFIWAIVILCQRRDTAFLVIMGIGTLYVAYRTFSAGRKLWRAALPPMDEDAHAQEEPRAGDEKKVL
jgi:hypothetical protein